MAFTKEELEIIKAGQSAGKTQPEIERAISNYRTSQSPAVSTNTPAAPAKKPLANKVTDFLGLKSATDVFGSMIARSDKGAAALGQDAEVNRANIPAPTKGQIAGAALQTGATAAGAALPVPAGLAAKAAVGFGAGYAFDIGQDLAEGKSAKEVITPGGAALIGAIAPGAGPAAKGTVKAASTASKAVTNSPVVKGALQSSIELAERVPRFVSKKQVTLRDAATRAERIANSPAPVGNAIKAGVDERIINTIEQADPQTRSGYQEIVRLAEESVSTTGTLKPTARPEIVAGDAAAKQYKLIDDQRKKIGQAIGETTKALSKDTVVPMQASYEALDETLNDVGIKVLYNETGASLQFGKTGFTKAQRAKINELYELATEGGDILTPAEIHAKDRLFSQLQRETRMEGIGDIMVEGPDGPISLFRVFRDVYSQNLETLSPELRKLNGQYRNLVTFTDDIENSIIKGGKFETNSAVDPAEFAQTNLRRLFSEAQSAADYRAIADEMDNASRALGYEGAKPEDLARFAYEIRKIYPESTPRTGIEGAFKASLSGIADAVLGAGKADLTDQQKALRELLESLSD